MMSTTGTLDAMAPTRDASPTAIARRIGAWVAAQAVLGALAAATGAWAAAPEATLAGVTALAGAAATPRRAWLAPIAVGLALGASAVFHALGLPAVVGSGAMVGAVVAFGLPGPTHPHDAMNAALAGGAGAGLGLWVAALAPPSSAPLADAVMAALLVGLGTSAALAPATMTRGRGLPSRREIRRLPEPYRAPIRRAVDLVRTTRRHRPDATTWDGLVEVARWVLALQRGLWELDVVLDTIDPDAVAARLTALPADGPAASRTREHLQRMLRHRDHLRGQRQRTDGQVTAALAFLEEARASLAIGRHLPADDVPQRLPEVLRRLREHAERADLRRRTSEEISRIHS